eukprot:30964-Rhodomonas_salina.1
MLACRPHIHTHPLSPVRVRGELPQHGGGADEAGGDVVGEAHGEVTLRPPIIIMLVLVTLPST